MVRRDVAPVRADRQRAAPGDVPQPDAAHHCSAAAAEVRQQGVQHVHGIDLGLAGQPQGALHGEREAGVAHVVNVQACGGSGGEFLAEPFRSLARGGVGVGVPALEGHAVLIEVAQQPGLALPVGLHVGPDLLRRILAGKRGQDRSLQQADLGRGVAGGHRARVPGFQHQDLLPGPREQQRGDQPRQSCPGHHGVVPAAGLEGVRTEGLFAVQPNRRHPSPPCFRCAGRSTRPLPGPGNSPDPRQ